MPRIVDVLVPVALDQTYSYRVPDGIAVEAGDLVAVPLGARECAGVVWGESAPRPGLHNRLKDFSGQFEFAPLICELRAFVDWVSYYSLSPRVIVLLMVPRIGDLS